MPQTLRRITAQIEKLQKEADQLRRREKSGALAQIQALIAEHGLTAEEIFPPERRRTARQATKPAAKKSGASKVRFKGPNGETWTGHGKRPGWYLALVAAGTPPKDLAAK